MDRERIIVLKKTVYRDSDLIIRGLNSQGTRLSFIAPGALKSRRRFGGGVLEPTHFIEVIYQWGSKAALPRLLEAQVLKEFQGLRRSYDLIQMGLYLLELVDRVSHDGLQHGEDLFNLLGHGLHALSQLEESTLSLFRLQFLLKFLFQQGVLHQEAWMDLFLRTPLKDHATLAQVVAKEEVESSTFFLDRLSLIEKQIKAYKETGASL